MAIPRELALFLTANLLVSALALSGCSGPCAGGDETVYPDSLDIRGQATYRSDGAGDVDIDLAAVTEPHYVDPIYDGQRLDLAWQLAGPMTFQLTLLGPIEAGTIALADLGAQLCACEAGFLQGPDDMRECFLSGQVSPAWCETSSAKRSYASSRASASVVGRTRNARSGSTWMSPSRRRTTRGSRAR